MLNLKCIVKYIVTYGRFQGSIFKSDLASYDHEKNI